MRSLLALLLIPAASILHAQAPAGDFDVSGQVFNPLDAAAKQATEAQVNGQSKPAEKVKAEAAQDTTKPASPVASATPTAPSSPATPAAPTSPLAAALLPALPEMAQSGVTQVGGMDLQYYNTPIEEVLRQLGRQLDRPLNYSFLRQYKITGTWTKTPADTILREVVASKGLVLKESSIAYTVEDHGRNIPLPTGKVTVVAPKPTGSPLADLLQENSLTEDGKPLSGKKRDKALSKNDEARDAALAKRKALLNEASR